MGELCLRPFGLSAVKEYLEQAAQSYKNINDEDADQVELAESASHWSIMNTVIPYIVRRELQKYPLPTYSDARLAQNDLLTALKELAIHQCTQNKDITPRKELPQLLLQKEIQEWLLWTGLVDMSGNNYFFTVQLIRDYLAVAHLIDYPQQQPELLPSLPVSVQNLLQQAANA